jgi:hypothetical protein
MRRAFVAGAVCNWQFSALKKTVFKASWLLSVLVVFPSAMPVAGQNTAYLVLGIETLRPPYSQELDPALAAAGRIIRTDPELVPFQGISTVCNLVKTCAIAIAPISPRLEARSRSSRDHFGSECQPSSSYCTHLVSPEEEPEDSPKASSVAITTTKHPRPDSNLEIYYRNRLEFGLDVGWHPVNIPFIYDFAVGDTYNTTPLKYTLVPIIASLRWHVTNVGWKWMFRGNTDFTFSGSITPIPRGPETHYYAFMFGIRRNFVYRNWKAVPFFEQRGGAGMIDAKEPLGVLWAQGQNLTFTYTMGAGVRYNANSKYSLSAGMNYMHISNGYLSEPAFKNYGINVYGPMFGIDVRLGKARHHDSE